MDLDILEDLKDLKGQVNQDILEDLKDLPDLLDHRRDLKDLVVRDIQDQVDHLQDIQDNLKDPLVHKVQATSWVHQVVRKDLVAQMDIPAVDQVVQRSQVGLLGQEVSLENPRRVRRSHRKDQRNLIVSTCRRGLVKHEAKLTAPNDNFYR